MNPVITDVFMLTCVTIHAHRATIAIPKPNFMMIPEGREFCFNIFLSFLITATFFFMRHPPCRSFFVSRATNGYRLLDRHIFSDKYARLKGKRKIFTKTARRKNMQD